MAAAPPEWLVVLGAAAVLAFALVLLWIAFSAGEWSPAFIALGCVSMAVATAEHLAGRHLILVGESTAAVEMLPFLGLFAGGLWFGLGAIPRPPLSVGMRPRTRITLAVLVVGTIVAGLGAANAPGQAPGAVLRAAAVVACLGYAYAAFQIFAAFRLLRLPSQLAMAAGSAGFIPVTLGLATGGLPFLPGWAQQSIMLGVAALPVTGFILEEHTRPGLRTMVLSLSVPGALSAMRRGYPGELTGLLNRINDYDPALRGHIDRVADLAVRTAETLGLSGTDLREVMLAGQLHDAGKLFVPRGILDKPGRLDPSEFARVQEHAEFGEALVRRIPELASAAAAVGQHHEKCDGTGYPKGLSGDEIRIAARIIAACDVYDALVTTRPYKPAWAPADALAEVQRGAGAEFDAEVVSALTSVLQRTMQLASAA